MWASFPHLDSCFIKPTRKASEKTKSDTALSTDVSDIPLPLPSSVPLEQVTAPAGDQRERTLQRHEHQEVGAIGAWSRSNTHGVSTSTLATVPHTFLSESLTSRGWCRIHSLSTTRRRSDVAPGTAEPHHTEQFFCSHVFYFRNSWSICI